MPYYEAIIIKKVYYWHRVEPRDQRNKDPKKISAKLELWHLTKVTFPLVRKETPFIEVGKWLSIRKKIKSNPYFI